MRKILIFSLTYLPFVGGAEIAIKEITDRIYDFEFDLICAKFDKKLRDQERIGHVNVYRVGKGKKLDKFFYPFYANKLAKNLYQKNNYQIIWAVLETWAGLAALLFKWRFPLKPKYILTLQSGDSDWFILKRIWFWYPLYKKIYQKADLITAISRWLEKRARRFGYKGKIEIVPNGVDIKKFKYQISNIKIEKLKDKLGIQENEKVVITVSRLVDKNGIEDLIKSIKLLITDYKLLNTKLIIIGTGKLEKRLKKLTKKLKLEDKVKFLGEISHEELPKYYQIADVFVRPSLSEGLGNAFLEAMAANVPVIATPVGGILDFLEEGRTGLLSSVKNPQSIADKIQLLLTDHKLLNTLRENGRKMVEEKYDWHKIASKMKNVFNKI